MFGTMIDFKRYYKLRDGLYEYPSRDYNVVKRPHATYYETSFGKG